MSSNEPTFTPIVRADPYEEPAKRKPMQVLAALVGFWLFLIALDIMKYGAATLRPLFESSGLGESIIGAFGLGWIAALMLMSGSPVALSALTLFAGDSIEQVSALWMMTGSRMGVSFVVYGLSLLYVYRHREKEARAKVRASIAVGVAVIALTAVVYLPGATIATALLETPAATALTGVPEFHLVDFISKITDPITASIKTYAPTVLLFPLGVGLLLLALRLFDLALPQLSSERLDTDDDLNSRRWLVFGVGFMIALITMSVSVALTLLVPAIAKGYVNRRHAVPYILGANISTLGDTLLGAALLGSGGAVAIVAAELIGITLITMLIMIFFYRPVQRETLRLTEFVSQHDRLALGLMGLGLLIPIVCLILGVEVS